MDVPESDTAADLRGTQPWHNAIVAIVARAADDKNIGGEELFSTTVNLGDVFENFEFVNGIRTGGTIKGLAEALAGCQNYDIEFTVKEPSLRKTDQLRLRNFALDLHP